MFERIARRQPRSRASVSPGCTSSNTGQSGSERASALASPSGSISPVSAASRSSAIVSTSRYDIAGIRRLDLRLELVVASEQLVRPLDAEELLELARGCPPFQSTSVP